MVTRAAQRVLFDSSCWVGTMRHVMQDAGIGQLDVSRAFGKFDESVTHVASLPKRSSVTFIDNSSNMQY